MKKIFSVLLAVAMLCTMSISAFAADVDTTGSETSKDLQVKYVENTNKQDAYAASITWGSMEFTYTSDGQYWDTDTMTWKDSENAGTWSSSTITIKNKSSQGISVIFQYKGEMDNKGVNGYMIKDAGSTDQTGAEVTDNEPKTINIAPAIAGKDGKNGSANIFEGIITPFGAYTGTNSDAVKVGTITIALGSVE